MPREERIPADRAGSIGPAGNVLKVLNSLVPVSEAQVTQADVVFDRRITPGLILRLFV